MTTNSSIWDKLVQRYGNEYQAVTALANLARDKTKEVDYHILDSEAIEWVLTGTPPKVVQSEVDKPPSDKFQYICEILGQIQDSDILHSVKSSLRISAQNAALCYVYAEGINKYQQQRVRIICNMIWSYRGE